MATFVEAESFDCFALLQDVLHDRPADGDRRFLAVATRRLDAVPHDRRLRPLVRRVLKQDEPAVGLDVLEDHVHNALEQFVAIDHRADELRQFEENLQVLPRRLRRLGHRHDHRVVIAGHGVLDRHIHHAGLGDFDWRLLLDRPRLILAEHDDRVARSNLVAGLKKAALDHAAAVDERAVVGLEIVDVPPAVIGRQLGMATRDRRVLQRQRLAGPPDELRLVVGQFEATSLVRAFDDGEDEHGGENRKTGKQESTKAGNQTDDWATVNGNTQSYSDVRRSEGAPGCSHG